MQFPVSAKQIIPHREAMLLLDELSFSSAELMEGTATIKPGNPFSSSRGLDGACFVELLAQLAAAGDGYESTNAGKPVRSGFLVGVNDFTIVGNAAVGESLRLKLQKGLQLNNFTIVEGNIHRGSNLIAKGNLKLFVMDDPGVKIGESMTESPLPPENGAQAESVIHGYFRKKVSGLESAPGGIVRGNIRFDPDFPGFRGHFPGYPIVPGIGLIHLVVVLAEEVYSCPLTLTHIDRAKFSRQVLPGDTATAELNVEREGDLFTIKAGLTVEGKPAASFNIKTVKFLPAKGKADV